MISRKIKGPQPADEFLLLSRIYLFIFNLWLFSLPVNRRNVRHHLMQALAQNKVI